MSPASPLVSADLAEQFPFLERLILQMKGWTPLGAGGQVDDPSVAIKVQNADAALMWRLLDYGAQLQDGNPFGFPGRLVRHRPYIFFCKGRNFQPSEVDNDAIFLRELFEKLDFAQVETVVTAELFACYKEPVNVASNYVGRTMRVAVHRAAAVGFADLYRLSKLSDVYATTFSLAGSHPEQRAIRHHLNQLAEVFDRQVLLGGLAERLSEFKENTTYVWEVDDRYILHILYRPWHKTAHFSIIGPDIRIELETINDLQHSYYVGIMGVPNRTGSLVETICIAWQARMRSGGEPVFKLLRST